MKRAGYEAPRDIILLAMACDTMADIRWMLGASDESGEKTPKHILPKLLGVEEHPKSGDKEAFESGDDFMAARAKLIDIKKE